MDAQKLARELKREGHRGRIDAILIENRLMGFFELLYSRPLCTEGVR